VSELTLRQKAAKGLLWGGFNNGLQQIIGAIVGVILLNNLSPDDYGLVGMLAIFTGIATTLQEGGFTSALTNREHFDPKDYNAVFWFSLFISLAIYVTLYICAPLIAQFYRQEELIVIGRILFLSFVLNSLSISHNALLFRRMMVKQRAQADLTAAIISGAVSIVVAIKGYGYWSLVIHSVLQSLVATIIKWYISPWSPTLKIDFTPIKEIFGFSFRLVLSTSILQIQNNIFSVLLGRFYTKSDVGYYSQGMKWSNMAMQIISGMTSSVAQPIFARTRNEKSRQVRLFRKLQRFVAFIAFPLMLGIIIIARDFIEIINEDFLPSVPILQIYCIFSLVTIFNQIYSHMVVAHGKSEKYLAVTILSAFIQIAVAIITCRFGIYWMAVSVTIANSIIFLVWFIITSRLIELSILKVIKDLAPFAIISVIVMVATHYLTVEIESPLVSVVVKIIVAATLYLATMRITGAKIFKECINFILNK
jgi:O-antigen/teichoic acid export membrane protein